MDERRTGFTLVETLIVVALMGLVAAVMALAITTMLRTSAPTTGRVNDARSIQGLTTWLPSDVASTPAKAANIVPEPVSLTCIGSETAPGSNLLELRRTTSGVSYAVGYRLEQRDDAWAVRRYACSDAAGYGDTLSTTVTAELANVFSVTAVPPYDLVAFDLQTTAGEPIRVAATPRDPDATLPPTTVAAPPPTPCSVSFSAPSYGPVGRFSSGAEDEKLLTSVALAFTVTGDTCGVLTVAYDTGYELVATPISYGGGTGSATIPQGDATPATPRWLDGTATLQVENDGFVMAGVTADLVVLP